MGSPPKEEASEVRFEPRAEVKVKGPGKHRDMKCHLAGGKVLEFVQDVQRYQRDIVGLTSTHTLGLERGWTIHYFFDPFFWADWRAGWCGLAYCPTAQLPHVGAHPGEQEGCVPAREERRTPPRVEPRIQEE